MKKRRRELAKPGIYGTVDNPKIVSKKDLLEIVETFPDIAKSPVSLHGHWPDPSKPRLANVVAVEYDEAADALVGDVEEHDTLAAAVDAGYYPDVSIRGERRASDGKMYLHHLAYLGEEPPAIKDLVSDILASFEEGVPAQESEAPDGIAASDAATGLAFPSPRARQLLLSDPAATNPSPQITPGGKAGGEKRKEASMDPLDEVIAGITDEAKKKAAADALAELKKQAEAAAKYKAKLEELAQKYPDEGIELSDSADPRIALLMKQVRDGKTRAVTEALANKLPKAKHRMVLDLADSLSVAESIELSDGEQKTKTSQLGLLTDILNAIPPMVSLGRLDLSDGDEGGETAVSARELIEKF